MADNIHVVKGIVYSKDVKTGPSKRIGEPDWKMCIMKIEAEANASGKKVNSICEYIFDWGVSFEDFAVKDHVELEFYFANKKYKRKDGTGTWEKEETRIVYMKFSDIRTHPPPKATGKVNVGSMTNPSELTNPKLPPKPDVFDTPRPSQMVKQDDGEEWDQLPF